MQGAPRRAFVSIECHRKYRGFLKRARTFFVAGPHDLRMSVCFATRNLGLLECSLFAGKLGLATDCLHHPYDPASLDTSATSSWKSTTSCTSTSSSASTCCARTSRRWCHAGPVCHCSPWRTLAANSLSPRCSSNARLAYKARVRGHECCVCVRLGPSTAV
jgi:hypothetical protein